MAATKAPLVVGLGEALFDCFPDRQVLGGAPVNVAVHAASLLGRLGGGALPATRVGNDKLGRRFVEELADRGVDTSCVQVDPERPTGTVTVGLQPDGEASYRFAPDAAWDFLELTDGWLGLAPRCSAVVFGTLAQRSSGSRATLRAFVESAPQAVRLFDANLRQDYFSFEVLDRSLQLANAAKMNLQELAVVGRLLGIAEAAGGPDPACRALAERYGLDWIAITRGPEGTALFVDGETHDATPGGFEPRSGADSVGAGDACAAGLIVGTLHGWPPDRTLALANALGAYVASRPGATPVLPQAILEKAADR